MNDKLLEAIRRKYNLLEDSLADELADLMFDKPSDYYSSMSDYDDDEEGEEVLKTFEEDAIEVSGPLYHGSHLDRAKEISKTLKLLTTPNKKTSGGLTSEGGLIWFTDDLELAKRWAASEIDIIASSGKDRKFGEVFVYDPPHPLKFIPRRHELTKEEADYLNEFYKFPDYKRLKVGDRLNTIELRSDTIGRPIKKYKADKEVMQVIYPPLLRDLGFDGIYDDSGYALAAEKDIIVDIVKIKEGCLLRLGWGRQGICY